MASNTQTSPAAATAGAADATKEQQAPRGTANRSTTPGSERFRDFIAGGWAPRDESVPSPRAQSPFAARRRATISRLYPGIRLVIPAGGRKQRANDTDYGYRAHSAFTWLTGWGSDSEPESVLVFDPADDGHEVTLYFRERAGRDSDEFYADPEIGEFWIGARPSLTQVAADLALPTRDLAEFDALAGEAGGTLVLREADAALTGVVDDARLRAGADTAALRERDDALARDLSEARLIKDDYEIGQLRAAIEATAQGFGDVIGALPRITAHPRGERVVEGVFNTRARSEGNAVGYDTIAASGEHACILHWTRNDGSVSDGELILIDAGVEAESYYTADITRTLPVNGRFSPTQRLVYEAVREAADAAFAIVRPGIRFRDVHATAMEVIARHTAAWGMLPVDADESLRTDRQYHRRYMVHGTSHHLGLDVHDCAQARREMYLDGEVRAGMVFTIEPGLYFQADDLRVPEEFRGIGVRIEDDILVTEHGAENLSIAIPRTADDVEEWMLAARR